MMRHPQKLHEIKLLENLAAERRVFETYLREKAQRGQTLNILEAGCGRHWMLSVDGIQYTLTGVDINEDILRFRQHQRRDLDKAVVGDLRTVVLEENHYDVIYCSFVLEHVDGAECVLSNFLQWLKPGGYLILRIPDRNSVYGFITRITPFWVHIAHWKYIQGIPNAGKPGHGPFPTHHDKIVSRNGIHQFCREHDMVIKAEYGSNYYMNRLGMLSVLLKLFIRVVHLSSLGKLAYQYNNLTYVLQKGDTPSLSMCDQRTPQIIC